MAKKKAKKDKKKSGIDFNDLEKRLGGVIGLLVSASVGIWFLMLIWEGITESWPW